jgi:hypothetical protein
MLGYVLIMLTPLSVLLMILWDISNLSTLWKNRVFLDVNVILTGVLAIFTGLACFVAYLQWRALETTDNTYWAGQRPWLGIDKKILFKSAFITRDGDVGGINVQFILTVKNVGNIPALGSRMSTTVLLDLTQTKQEVDYYSLKKMDDQLHSSINPLCKAAEYLPNRVNDSSLDIETGDFPSVFPKENSDTDVSTGANFPVKTNKIRSIFFVGCVNYKFGYGNSRDGHTFFVIKLDPKDDTLDISKDGETAPLNAILLDHMTWAD